MTRPIKFRAFWKHPEFLPEWKMYWVAWIIYGEKEQEEPECFIHQTPVSIWLVELWSTYNKIWWNPASQINLMQFTWLYDKNGKEIYEGDIIKCIEFSDSGSSRFDWRNSCENEVIILVKDIFTLHQFEIEWREFYSFWFQDEAEGYRLYWSWYNPNTYEVIWNIYENPELLSK